MKRQLYCVMKLMVLCAVFCVLASSVSAVRVVTKTNRPEIREQYMPPIRAIIDN